MLNGYKILIGARYFSPEALQNYLIYILYKRYFRFFSNIAKALWWKSIELLEKSFENITTSDSNFASTLINYYPLPNL